MLRFYVDTQEIRNQYDRQVMLETGPSWDMYGSGTTSFLDMVTQTGMLVPNTLRPEWMVSGSAPYSRLGTADYNGLTAGAWANHSVKFDGDHYCYRVSGTALEQATTKTSWPINQPMFVSWYSFNAGNDARVEIECGWGTAATDPKLRVWSNGNVEVWKGGLQVGDGNLYDNAYYRKVAGPNTPSAGVSKSLAGQFVDLHLIPCRRRELLVLSNQGGGFNWVFSDMSADSVGTITPTGPFWWYVPGTAVSVQCAPIRFPASGTIYGPARTLRYAPGTADTPAFRCWWDAPGSGSVSATASMVQGTSTAAFVPDGTAKSCRVAITLAGDGTVTPYLYAAEAVWPSGTVSTYNASTEITPWVCGEPAPELEVGEGPDGTWLTCTIKSPITGAGGTAPNIQYLANRPGRVTYGSVTLVAGRWQVIDWEEAHTDAARRLHMRLSDGWLATERYTIIEPRPEDGWTLDQAYREYAALPGFAGPGGSVSGTANWSVEASTLKLGSVPSPSQDEWGSIPDIGETAGGRMKRIWEDFDRLSFVGWRPGTASQWPQFYRMQTLGTVSSGTIWTQVGYMGGSAGTVPVAAGGTTSLVCRRYTERPIEPEANDIRVTGYDPRTGTVLQAHLFDLAAQDPTTAPASRPSNWRGEITPYGFMDPSITSMELAVAAGTILYERLSQVRWEAEWESSFLLAPNGRPLWRGDVETINGKGRYRILHFNVKFTAQGTATNSFGERTDATYTGQWIGS